MIGTTLIMKKKIVSLIVLQKLSTIAFTSRKKQLKNCQKFTKRAKFLPSFSKEKLTSHSPSPSVIELLL